MYNPVFWVLTNTCIHTNHLCHLFLENQIMYYRSRPQKPALDILWKTSIKNPNTIIAHHLPIVRLVFSSSYFETCPLNL